VYTPEELEAQRKVESAVQEYMQTLNPSMDEGLEFLGDWYLIGEIVNPEKKDQAQYFRAMAGGALPLHRILGLLNYASMAESASSHVGPE
jgi:hypothetical protein